MKIAIATCTAWPDLIEPEKSLIPLFNQHGIKAEPAIWNDAAVNWQQYNAIIIRSTWDYFKHIIGFNQWLDMLEANNIYTLNPVATIRENHHKFYLRNLQQKGVEIIPTLFFDKANQFDLSEVKQQGWQKAVVKPAVSGGAYLTKVFEVKNVSAVEKEYGDIARERELLVQPFIPAVLQQGELSLLFFNRKYSHAVRKVPQPGDFRVQQEHGGSTTLFNPDASVITTAEKILSLVNGDLLYARVDGVLIDGRFLLMELELIEPYLFFDYKEGSREEFVQEAMAILSKRLMGQIPIGI